MRKIMGGSDPISEQEESVNITIDGDFSDWYSLSENVVVNASYNDNNTSRNNLEYMQLCSDGDFLYFYFQYKTDSSVITYPEGGGSVTVCNVDSFRILLNLDDNSETGYYHEGFWSMSGADILISGSWKDNFATADVCTYAGTSAREWTWTAIDSIHGAVTACTPVDLSSTSGAIIEGSINLKMLPMDISSLQNETKTLEHSAEDYAAIEETIAYKPEESWNYEVGTHLNFFDSKMHFDLALYYMQIRNQQLSIMEPNSNYGRIMVNAGKSHSCGLETTLRGRFLDNALDWALTYSFTSAKFDEYIDDMTPTDDGYHTADKIYIKDYSDNYVPFVPQHMFSAVADYHIGKFTIGANVTGQGKTWWDEANTYAQKFYAVLGAHADYDFGPVVVSLWGRNLTDTKYNTFAIQSSAAGGTRYFAQKANPIQVGMDVNIHF